MSHRFRAVASIWTLLAVGAALLVAVAPVAAKEGAQAQLTTTIPRDATPGSTLAVEWDAFMPSPVRRDPIMEAPIFIRLSPVGGGKATEGRATERPSGSGHYVAEVIVPKGGIGRVEIGLLGEICQSGKGCIRDDIMLVMVGTVMADSTDPAAAKVVAVAPVATAVPVAAASVAPAVTTPAAQAPVAPGIEPGWVAAIAVILLATAALIAAARVIRRRGASTPPLTSGPTRT
jgi:hypothetical protein